MGPTSIKNELTIRKKAALKTQNDAIIEINTIFLPNYLNKVPCAY
jgi:hypothetical protein